MAEKAEEKTVTPNRKVRGMWSASPIPHPNDLNEADDMFEMQMQEPAPHNGTLVSKLAANAIHTKLPFLRQKVLNALVDGPMISTEVLIKIDHPHLASVKPRLTELMNQGYVKKEGMRPNPSGFLETIWAITTEGHTHVTTN